MIETIFSEKTIKKIIIAIVFVFMFNFTFSYLGNNVVFATEGEVMNDEEIMEEEGGGKLLLPIHALLLFLSDAALELLQRSFVAELPVTITAIADEESNVNGAAIAGIVIGVVVLCVACVVTYGAAAAIAGSVGTAVARSNRCGSNCRSGSCWNSYRSVCIWRSISWWIILCGSICSWNSLFNR